jgi:hypothetical protein
VKTLSVLKTYQDDFKINENEMITFKEMGNIYEIDFSSRKNYCPQIQLLDKDHYLNLKTGEVIECKHIVNRSENKFQVGQSLKRLRDLINTNVIDTRYWKWITLTYAKNMQDTKQLYKDFEKFMKRVRYRFNKFNIEYIIACEPQARGAWHIHLLLGFDKIAPFIPNATIEELWGNGFTKTTQLDNIDNVGAYLTAYLGDMELTEENISILVKKGLELTKNDIKEVSELDGIKLKEPKSFIKGGRLYMYPPKFNLYRASRGMKKPKVEKMPYYDAKKKVGSLKPTYTSCINITDTNNNFSNQYYYEYYNKVREISK